MSNWLGRLRRAGDPRELHEVADAAEGLAARHPTGRRGIAFTRVADTALLGTLVINSALGSVHLWRALFPKEREGHHEHLPEHGRCREVAVGDNAPERVRTR